MKQIVSLSGTATNYKYKNYVYIISYCNGNNSKSIKLDDDKLTNVPLGIVKLFTLDDSRIYWCDQNGSIYVMERGDKN